MYENLAWLMYFCNEIHQISAQRIFVSCLLHKYNKNLQEFGHILAKKL